MSRTLLALLLIGGLALVGCESEQAAEETEETEESEGELVEEEEEEVSADSVAVADFQDEIVGSVCYSYENCDNEILREGLLTSALMVSAMGIEMGGGPVSDELRTTYTEFGERMEAMDDEGAFPAEECPNLFNIVTTFLGLDAATLGAAVESGALEYDADAAGACVAHIRNLPDACGEETTIEGEFSLEQFQVEAQKHEAELEAYMEGCSGIFVGTREISEACTHDYECANDVDCQWDAEAGTGECAESEAAPF